MMDRFQITASDFDLKKTLNSGQVFHWEKVGAGFIGTIGDLPVQVWQTEQTVIANVASASSRCSADHGQDVHATIRHYFALDHRLTEICESFPNDSRLREAANYCRGLRIIRQPKWECLATFICSSMKQVAHIRQMSHALRRRFGQAREIDGHVVYTFPAAPRLSESTEKELRECALGYRAKNLLATAQMVASGEADLEKWAGLSDLELGIRLCTLPGVGTKVANCVMLFAYERLRAFPIDVWIERVLREQYFARKRKPTTAKLRAFTADHFGENGGYAQQYLFHHARMTSRRRAAK